MRVEVGGHVRFLHKFLCQKRRPGTFRIICMQCNRTHNPKISTFAVLTCFFIDCKNRIIQSHFPNLDKY